MTTVGPISPILYNTEPILQATIATSVTTPAITEPLYQPFPNSSNDSYARSSNGYQYSNHSPHEGSWNAQAGPSTYRNMPSPASIPSREASVRGSSKLREDDDGRAGVEDPCGERKYTELKCLGDGSFGTVWLCDWHSPVKSDVLLSAMQCGAGARPEWAGKRLVALKRMKRVWEGGWSQAKNLGELVSLRRIPSHPNVIPLYDAFISPKSRELYFVFECMEGNLYQLTKSRRGRPLAAGLIASCFHQISQGLFHIHQFGYFHRDMKPENLLVTTTGLTDYLTASTLNSINAARREGRAHDMPRTPNGDHRYEKDVMVIVKLADFGLARETNSKPPYTEYVSTRWYRAPEVLLRSTEYGPPVDMWALGTILAEMVTLKPLFPGVSEIDQVYRICDTLGDPSPDYGSDETGRQLGGGPWNTGIKLAKNVGFSFPKRKPVNFRGLFNENVPQSLVDCIADLLRYNPRYRLTSAQCIDHAYFHETLPHLQQTPPLPRIAFSQGQPPPHPARQTAPELNAPPRQVPPSHSHQEIRPAFANGDMRMLPPPVSTPDSMAASAQGRMFFPGNHSHQGGVSSSALVHQLRELDLPTDDLSSYGNRPVADPNALPPVDRNTYGAESMSGVPNYLSVQNLHISERMGENEEERRVKAFVEAQQAMSYDASTPIQAAAQMPMPPRNPVRITPNIAPPAPTAIAKKKKWGLSSVFGSSEKHLPIPEESSAYSGSSLKRTQSGTHPNARAPVNTLPTIIDDPKKTKKEEQRIARELEKAKREAAERAQKERARAVMRKREQLEAVRQANHIRTEVEFGEGDINNSVIQRVAHPFIQPPMADAYRHAHPNPSVQSVQTNSSNATQHPNHQAMSPSPSNFAPHIPGANSLASIRSQESLKSNHSPLSASALATRDRMEEVAIGRHKARKRDDDDDHSMSSFDVNSLRSRSVLTVGTIDSDPGPRRPPGTGGTGGWNDPADPINRRHASHSTGYSKSHSKSRLMSGSNPSLESQLAHDFTVHANLAASGSSTSLGRHGASNLSVHELPPPMPSIAQGQQVPPGHPFAQQLQGSAPTSPYGHPKGSAVSHGMGLGRMSVAGGSNHALPSISDWQGDESGASGGELINPMFRVPPAQNPNQQQHTTLPPFSAIARVADTHQRQR